MNQALIVILKAAASWATKKILSALYDSIADTQGTDFVGLYIRLLEDIRSITGEVIERNEIERCEAELRAITWSLSEITDRYSAPAPTDILTVLRLQKDKITSLLYQNERFFVKTFQAYYLLNTLLMAAYGELAKLDPEHSTDYRHDALNRLAETEKAFKKYSPAIFQKRATLIVNRIPFHMDEKGIYELVPDPPHRPGFSDKSRRIRVGTEYRHYFNFTDIDGRAIAWDGGWKRNRVESHNAGASQLSSKVWTSKFVTQLMEQIRSLRQGLADAKLVLSENKSFDDLSSSRPMVAQVDIDEVLFLSSAGSVVELLGEISALPPQLKFSPQASAAAAPQQTLLASNPNAFHKESVPVAAESTPDNGEQDEATMDLAT
ncbi:MAG: hypothetical protein KAT71_01300 [Gammaproteobacteria bacterium]|nr:hypothetical protein [Gammaproteobacteria bacterium]